jgi:hypothetical protein
MVWVTFEYFWWRRGINKHTFGQQFIIHGSFSHHVIPSSQSPERFLITSKKELQSLGPDVVAYAYNPSYLGGRDQEDCSSKTAWAKS